MGPLTSAEAHRIGILIEFGLAAITIAAVSIVVAPYGRHTRAGWGPAVPQRIGWVLMEWAAVILWFGIYAQGSHAWEPAPLVLMLVWMTHYVHRTFVFPLRLRADGKVTPWLVVALANAFNVVNAYVNAWQVGEIGAYPTSWLLDPRFLVGIAVFYAGYAINQHADAVLMGLRKPGETGYKIPVGGLYRWVSCPNYLGEILEWTGWAIATWSWAGLAFAAYTIANLAPRAGSHHRWYRATFPDYPKERRALFPGVW